METGVLVCLPHLSCLVKLITWWLISWESGKVTNLVRLQNPKPLLHLGITCVICLQFCCNTSCKKKLPIVTHPATDIPSNFCCCNCHEKWKSVFFLCNASHNAAIKFSVVAWCYIIPAACVATFGGLVQWNYS